MLSLRVCVLIHVFLVCLCAFTHVCVSIFRRPSSRSVVLVFLALEI